MSGAAYFEPGELVVADLAIVNRDGDTKRRPVVLLYVSTPNQDIGHRQWSVVGLTTLSHYLDGTPHVPCPQQSNPTIGPSDPATYLWSQPANVPESCIFSHIGWANDQLIDVIADVANPLTRWQIEAMRPQARHDRRRSALRSG